METPQPAFTPQPRAVADALCAGIGPVRVDEHGRLAEELHCRRCGYNLLGLPLAGLCPECACPVGRALRGDFLRFSDPTWVEKLASGMNWIVAGIVVALLGGLVVGILAAGMGLPPESGVAIELAIGAVSLIGYWKLTTPDPAAAAPSGNIDARVLVRITQVGGLALSVPQPYLEAQARPVAAVLALCGGIVGIVGFFATFIYARRLALRIPNEGLARDCNTVMWGLVITTIGALVFAAAMALTSAATPPGARLGVPAMGAAIGGCTVGVAYLVFGIFALVLIFRFRRALNEAARVARATWAAGVPGLE